MFETVQPEQNSGSSKVVGVVIVAVVVVMVGFYFLFLRGCGVYLERRESLSSKRPGVIQVLAASGRQYRDSVFGKPLYS